MYKQQYQLVLSALLFCSTLAFSLRSTDSHNGQQHQYWFLKDNPVNVGDDGKWNYCDYRCLTLERFTTNKDFVVIYFTATLKDDFAACYVKTGNTYTLWSKVVENAFYQKYCGEDYKDWVNESDFTIKKIYGTGIGASLNETELYTKY